MSKKSEIPLNFTNQKGNLSLLQGSDTNQLKSHVPINTPIGEGPRIPGGFMSYVDEKKPQYRSNPKRRYTNTSHVGAWSNYQTYRVYFMLKQSQGAMALIRFTFDLTADKRLRVQSIRAALRALKPGIVGDKNIKWSELAERLNPFPKGET